MSTNKKGLSSIIAGLTARSLEDLSLSKSLLPASLTAPEAGDAEKAAKPLLTNETKALSLRSMAVPAGINFGNPSSNGTATKEAGMKWGQLLKEASSGGVASTVGGSLSSIAGLGGLVSGVAGLFSGGKSALPPLVHFQLPTSESQTLSVGSGKSSPAQQGTTGPVSSPAGTNSNGQGALYQGAQLAQAVKLAILNSSSLNDVISEL